MTNQPDLSMKYLRSHRRHSFRLVAVSLAISWLGAFAHEPTRRAHEASLDPREEKALANAPRLAALAPRPSAAAPPCQLTIRLRDATTGEPLPGLVRITRTD